VPSNYVFLALEFFRGIPAEETADVLESNHHDHHPIFGGIKYNSKEKGNWILCMSRSAHSKFY
jgi:hypothetical protein